MLKDRADFEKVIKNEEIKNQELVRGIEQWRKKFEATKIVRKYCFIKIKHYRSYKKFKI